MLPAVDRVPGKPTVVLGQETPALQYSDSRSTGGREDRTCYNVIASMHRRAGTALVGAA
jgi:hypothetical protein